MRGDMSSSSNNFDRKRGRRSDGCSYSAPTDALAAAYLPLPDSLPPLGGTDSQLSVVVIDSQGGVSSEPGLGAQRDSVAKAEKAVLVSDARAELARAEAALVDAEAVVRARERTVREMKQLVYDLTGGR